MDTSGGSPIIHDKIFPMVELANGVYISTTRECDPGDIGINALPYPRTTSLPRKSKPYTLNVSRGQPNTFVDLKVISMGKFQIIPSSE